MLLIFFTLAVSTIFLFTYIFNEFVYDAIYFALLVLNIIVFVYIELKQSLIMETKPNPFCLSHLFALFHKFALILPGTHYWSQKKKSLCYFLETAMYECSIFWMMMMALINWVINAVLFWLEVIPGRIW